MTGNVFFQNVDLKNGYYQMRTSPDDAKKPMIETKYGQFKLLITSLGLMNALAIFRALFNSISRKDMNGFVIKYSEHPGVH